MHKLTRSFKEREKKLNGDDFTRIYFNPNKHCVIFHEMPFLNHFVRDKARKTKTQRIRFFAWTLEILPGWVRNKTFNYIASFFWAS